MQREDQVRPNGRLNLQPHLSEARRRGGRNELGSYYSQRYCVLQRARARHVSRSHDRPMVSHRNGTVKVPGEVVVGLCRGV